MHNGKYYTEQYKQKQAAKLDRLYGPIERHKKFCNCCGKEFIYEGRIKTKAFLKAKFCNRSCANNRQDWWNENVTHYRTIALKYWDRECAICGFDKIIAVHHVDENKKNNDKENLIPLCPNHHEMVHSKWKNEVQPLIIDIVKEKW